MAAIPYHVVESFKRKQRDSAGAFVSDGQTLKSYALTVAHWENGAIVVDVDLNGSFSVTTSRHVNALRNGL